MRMQIIDADYIINDDKPIVRLFGRKENNEAITAYDDNFKPYFYVSSDDYSKLIEFLKEEYNGRITKLEEVERYTPIGYTNKPEKVLKVFTKTPVDVPKIRNEIQNNKLVKQIYEADILFKYRYMVDNGLYGMNWVDIKGKGQRSETIKTPVTKIDEIKQIDKMDHSELKYLAFDIEVIASEKNSLPNEDKDPIILISMAFTPDWRNKKDIVLVAKPCNAKNAMSFSNEKEMLEKFVDIINDYDPDIITGYNINNFDIPYVLRRLELNKLSKYFGRVNDKPAFSRQLGMIKTTNIPGRVVVDPYEIIKNDPWIKLKRYNLDTVSEEFLGEKKIDVKYTEMEKLWHGDKKDLLKFIEYSRKDSVLALRIVLEANLMDKFFELSRVSGLVLQDTLGGQTMRVETCLLHKFKDENILFPLSPSKEEVARRAKERAKAGLKGAIVLDPIKGLHADGSTMVLDFKSLYPSLIRTYNICPTTLVTKKSPKIKEKHKSPVDAEFVDHTVREGILPEVLKILLQTRSDVKKQMKKATGREKKMLNAKQLALKTMANSFYGYTGYLRAKLYVMDIANSITAYGRFNIEKTKKIVEDKYKLTVVYGDTDSVFVKTPETDLDKVKKLGDEIGDHITNVLPGVLELEFEKIYRTFLILSKKRYAGWKFEPSKDGWKNKIDMKGIETVRRDWCSLVTNTMNHILNTILTEGDVRESIEYVKKIIDDLKNNRVPLEELTVIKGITKKLDNYKGTLPHIELARKMERRDPTFNSVGTRIGYVIIKGNQMLSKRAEDPEYVREHKLQIDSEYYIENQLLPPVLRILNAVGVSRSELFGEGRQSNIRDIMNGSKRKLNHKIDVKYNDKKDKELKGWEDFVCEKCKKSYRTMPLSGLCSCGGKILIGFQGNIGNKVVLDK